jgi:hypothetical protein
LTAVCTAYPAPPLLALFHPPIKAATSRPRSHLDLHGQIDFSAIRVGTLPHLVVAEIHI